MVKEKKSLIVKTLWYLVAAAMFALVIPIIFNVCNANDVTKIGYVMFVFDMVFSVVIGLLAGKHNDSWVVLLFFPVLFMFFAGNFFMGILRIFGILYLAASLLAYGITKD